MWKECDLVRCFLTGKAQRQRVLLLAAHIAVIFAKVAIFDRRIRAAAHLGPAPVKGGREAEKILRQQRLLEGTGSHGHGRGLDSPTEPLHIAIRLEISILRQLELLRPPC